MEPNGAPWRVLESPSPEAAATAEPPPTRPAVPWVAVAVGVAALAVVAAVAVVVLRPEPIAGVEGAGAFAAGAALVDDPAPSPSAVTPAGQVVVAVSGAVAHPGVYRLPAGSRVGDAIAAAGGYGSGVDAALADRQLNLAAVVKDGEKVRVPMRGEAAESVPPGAAGGAGATGGAGGLVDLNHATAEELDRLPGVGPATAAKIIAARAEQPFSSVDDLGARKVVGAATLEKIRDLVTAGP